jgi:uncharacterized membrane protein YeiB
MAAPTPMPTRTGVDRNPSIDATRTVALLGIIILNYHGYLNGYEAIGAGQENFFVRIMDAWNGVLAPSPVVFVLVSGISCSLLASANFDRWTLVRRGVLLLALGSMFEWVWNGTILPYFGLYFLIAAGIVTWSHRHIVTVAIVCTASAAVLSMWRFFRERDFHSTSWLSPAKPDSPRNFVFRYFVDYTHPVFPWFAFFCVGLLVGRSLPWFFANRRRLVGPLVIAVTVVYTFSTAVRRGTDGPWQQFTSTDPFERGILATVGVTLSALLVLIVVSWVVEAFPTSPITDLFVRAGRNSLTLYVAHGLAYNLVVNTLGWVRPTGLDAALGLATVMWVLLVGLGAWWDRFIGRGPLERLLRGFGR